MLRREKNCIAEGEGSLEVCLEPTRPDFQYYKGNNVWKDARVVWTEFAFILITVI